MWQSRIDNNNNNNKILYIATTTKKVTQTYDTHLTIAELDELLNRFLLQNVYWRLTSSVAASLRSAARSSNTVCTVVRRRAAPLFTVEKHITHRMLNFHVYCDYTWYLHSRYCVRICLSCVTSSLPYHGRCHRRRRRRTEIIVLHTLVVTYFFFFILFLFVITLLYSALYIYYYTLHYTYFTLL